MKRIFIFILGVSALFGCETTINPRLDDAANIIVVDAWINQKAERQEIRIMRSQKYFDNSTPVKVPGASVRIEDLNTGMVYDFIEGEESYYWDPGSLPFGVVGHNYKLTVVAEGETFEAFSKLGRVPPIDSIIFKFNKENLAIRQDHYTAEFLATDPVGVGDAYWIKTWKNTTYLNKPGELNMAYDAGFSSEQSIDGKVFLIPIRKNFLNPMDENPKKKGEFLPPYVVGDSIHVEIHSVNPMAFDFLYALFNQINRPGGFAELFAVPLANSSTNIRNVNQNSPVLVAGFFNVAAVSSRGAKLTQAIANEAKQNGAD